MLSILYKPVSKNVAVGNSIEDISLLMIFIFEENWLFLVIKFSNSMCYTHTYMCSGTQTQGITYSACYGVRD